MMNRTFTYKVAYYQKALSILLVSALCWAGLPTALAGSKEEKEVRRVEKIKAGINQLGIGNDSRIVVKLRDKRTLVGYISAINNDSFVITEAKTGEPTTIPYPAVTAAKGNHKALWITLGAVGVGVLILYLVLIRPYCNNEGC